MNNPANSETPRTDAFAKQVGRIIAQRLTVPIAAEILQKEIDARVGQLEKELNETKAAIHVMEHGKYGRADLSEQIRQLTSHLEASERANSELRIALEGMSELCGNYFDESQLVCVRDKEIWKQHLDVLSSTSGQSYIPSEVGEKMYHCIDKMDFTQRHQILQLAQSFGLGKESK